jgi:hypothetical protein
MPATIRGYLCGTLCATALLTIVAGIGPSAASAQSSNARKPPVVAPHTAPAPLTPSQLSLDSWILMRFRGAQLLPDSGTRPASVIAHAGAPRIEGPRTSNQRDTIVAVHFDTTFWRPTLAAGVTVRFVDSSGEISPITARVVSRRAFRAPRTPEARGAHGSDWRIGWAYLVAVPSRTANAATAAFNGWSLVEAPLAIKGKRR